MFGRSKWGNKKVVIDGITFDSTKEGERYVFLKGLYDKGVISNLRLQVPYLLMPKLHYLKKKTLKTKVRYDKRLLYDETEYRADFVYEYDGRTVVEDVKGSKRTVLSDFKLKQKMMYYMHGIIVHLIFRYNEPIPEPVIICKEDASADA